MKRYGRLDENLQGTLQKNRVFCAVMPIHDQRISRRTETRRLFELTKLKKAPSFVIVGLFSADHYLVPCLSLLSTKSSMRTLPLVGSFAEYFKEAKAAQEVNKKVCGNCYNYEYDGYVFVDELGDLMRPEYLTSYFPQYIQKHGCKRMRFHDLRHSCASLLLANGVPLKQIQEWLGHSDFSTTANIYAHLDYTSKLSSAKAMVSGMALPESVNFGSKWAEISADDGKN